MKTTMNGKLKFDSVTDGMKRRLTGPKYRTLACPRAVHSQFLMNLYIINELRKGDTVVIVTRKDKNE